MRACQIGRIWDYRFAQRSRGSPRLKGWPDLTTGMRFLWDTSVIIFGKNDYHVCLSWIWQGWQGVNRSWSVVGVRTAFKISEAIPHRSFFRPVRFRYETWGSEKILRRSWTWPMHVTDEGASPRKTCDDRYSCFDLLRPHKPIQCRNFSSPNGRQGSAKTAFS